MFSIPLYLCTIPPYLCTCLNILSSLQCTICTKPAAQASNRQDAHYCLLDPNRGKYSQPESYNFCFTDWQSKHFVEEKAKTFFLFHYADLVNQSKLYSANCTNCTLGCNFDNFIKLCFGSVFRILTVFNLWGEDVGQFCDPCDRKIRQ